MHFIVLWRHLSIPTPPPQSPEGAARFFPVVVVTGETSSVPFRVETERRYVSPMKSCMIHRGAVRVVILIVLRLIPPIIPIRLPVCRLNSVAVTAAKMSESICVLLGRKDQDVIGVKLE